METPVRAQRVHTAPKTSLEHTPLGKPQMNQNGVFTPEQNVTTGPLSRRTLETPAKEEPSLGYNPTTQAHTIPRGGFTPVQSTHFDTKAENLNGGFTPVQGVHTDRKPSHTPLANAQGNPNSGFTPATSNASGVTPKNLIFNVNRSVEGLKMTSVDQGQKERKVFNGMTLVLDNSPVNGFSLTPIKSTELKTDDKVENQVSHSALKKNPESETLSEEQLSSSPVLFATPSTTPSPSPVKQEPNPFKFSQGEDRTDVNSTNLDVDGHEPCETKVVTNQENNLGEDSVDTSNKIKSDYIVEPSLSKGNITGTLLADVDNKIETSLVVDKGNENCVPSRKLFRSRKSVASVSDREERGVEAQEEKKPRDLLDDLKDDSAMEESTGVENKNSLAEPKVECDVYSKGVAAKKMSEVPSNVRQSKRRSTRLRRSSLSTGNAKKRQEETKEVRAKS